MNNPTCVISIVVPFYNEESNVRSLCKNLIKYLEKNFKSYEVILVNDGSKDNTSQYIHEIAKVNKNIIVVDHKVNKGYAQALASGFSKTKGDYVFYMDGDNQFNIKDLSLLWKEKDKADIVVGYRKDRKDNEVRKLNALIWNIFMKVLFSNNLKVRDIDCGFKLLNRKAVNKIKIQSNGSLFSTELLVKASKLNLKIMEVGVNHYPRLKGKPTGGNLKVIVKAFTDLYTLYKYLK